MLYVSETELLETNEHLPSGSGTIDFSVYLCGLQEQKFTGLAILQVDDLPKFGGCGRDTEEALTSSRHRRETAIATRKQ